MKTRNDLEYANSQPNENELEKENKNYSVSVWDIQFYMVDEDGNEKLDKNGEIQKYQLKPMRFKPLEYLCEDLTEDELIKLK